MRQLLVNKIQTPDGTVLHSKHRHDYITHIDSVTGEFYMLDGGNEYQRMSVNKVAATNISIYSDMPHDIIRQHVTWGAIDVTTHERMWIPVQQLSEEHIQNILRTQRHISGKPIEKVLLDELEFRRINK